MNSFGKRDKERERERWCLWERADEGQGRRREQGNKYV